ncbi:hypothetical protein P9112_003334 [Eukaryota sp. TZLM1-RC]
MRPVDRPYLTSLSEEDVCMFLSEFEVYQSVTDSTKVVSLRLFVDPFILKSLELYKLKVKTSDSLAESLVFRINDQLLPDFKTLVKVATDKIVDYDRSKVWLGSISSTNTRSVVRDTDIPAKTCYKCHKPAHIAVNCPRRNGTAQTFDVKRFAHLRHIAVNCPLRNGTAQTFDVKRSAHVHSIRELEQVNTEFCVVSEADINNCSDSCLSDALNVYDSDSSEEEPYELVLNPLARISPSLKKENEEGVVLDVGKHPITCDDVAIV